VHGEHGRDMFDLHGKNWKYNLLRRTARPFVSRYVAVSKDLANWLRETVHVPERKISQIYNGVDSVKFQPRHGLDRTGLPKGFAGPDSLVIGSVGRMAEVKNFPSLVRAFMCLASVSSDMADRVRLVIVGDGVARQACLDLLDQSGLSKLAWLPGERSDVAEIMRSLDVFVLPSLNEGISNTILEAQASGLPVIATRVGGNVELVEENVNGLLVEPNDEEGLARALQGYFENPALSKRHGAIARSRVEHAFSIPAMVQSYETVYRQVLEGVK
jgi:sugar transferase (PEP-CTERM/EpsH1 system associated)